MLFEYQLNVDQVSVDKPWGLFSDFYGISTVYWSMLAQYMADVSLKYLFPIFHDILYAGLPSFVFTRCQMEHMEREHAKQVLKTRFYFNYSTHYSGTDNQLKVIRDFSRLFSFD